MRHCKFPKKTKRKARASLIGSIEDNIDRPVKGTWNDEPAAVDLDQPLSRKQQKFAELLKDGQQSRKRKNTKKQHDALHQIGKFKRLDFESDTQFVNRVCRETTTAVNEQLLKIRYSSKDEEPEKKKAKKPLATPDEGSPDDYKPTNISNVAVHSWRKRKRTEKEKKTIDSSQKSDNVEHNDNSAKCSRHQANDDYVMNATEVIPFGERADAPPDFKWRHNDKKIGRKTLALNHNEPSRKMDDQERSRIIDLYRLNKKRHSIRKQ